MHAIIPVYTCGDQDPRSNLSKIPQLVARGFITLLMIEYLPGERLHPSVLYSHVGMCEYRGWGTSGYR